MNAASTEAATSVIPQMTSLFLWPSENVMQIYTGGPFLSDTTITVRIQGTALDKDGVPLGEPFSFSFRTAPFRVRYTYPHNAELFVSLTQPITVDFNSYVILSSAESAFSISPPISGTIAYGGYSPYEIRNQIIFTPSTAMTPNIKYTVRVSTFARDLFNVPMKEPYSFSFVTRPN
jgi:hypothetical protein